MTLLLAMVASTSSIPIATPTSLSKGKPPLPKLTSTKKLSDYVSPRSIIFLERFTPNYEKWLTTNPPWDQISEYQEAKAIVRAIVPVNDPAERLVAVAKRYKVLNLKI